jgi:hypothetical protein
MNWMATMVLESNSVNLITSNRLVHVGALGVAALVLSGCGHQQDAERILDGRSDWASAELVRPRLQMFEAAYSTMFDRYSKRSEVVDAKMRLRDEVPSSVAFVYWAAGAGVVSAEECVELRCFEIKQVEEQLPRLLGEANFYRVSNYYNELGRVSRLGYTHVSVDGAPEVFRIENKYTLPEKATPEERRKIMGEARLAVEAFFAGELAKLAQPLLKEYERCLQDALDFQLGAGSRETGRGLRLQVLERLAGKRLEELQAGK